MHAAPTEAPSGPQGPAGGAESRGPESVPESRPAPSRVAVSPSPGSGQGRTFRSAEHASHQSHTIALR